MTRPQRNDQPNIKLDNSVLGKVTGWLRFVGMKEVLKLDLAGDFHRDIRGTKVRLHNPNRLSTRTLKTSNGSSPWPGTSSRQMLARTLPAGNSFTGLSPCAIRSPPHLFGHRISGREHEGPARRSGQGPVPPYSATCWAIWPRNLAMFRSCSSRETGVGNQTAA
jgi:hypothetical protein